MNIIIKLIAMTLAMLCTASADEPQSLSMDGSGNIAITTATLGTLKLIPSVNDTAVKGFQNESPIKAFTPAQGNAVESTGRYKLSGGVAVDLTVGATISGNSTEVKAKWEATGDADGTVRIDLNIPPDQAKDMTITLNGKEIAVNGKTSGHRYSYPEEIVFTRTSTYTELYRITSSMLQGVVVNGTNGYTVCLATMPGGNCLITDTTEAAWTLEFSE